MYCCYLFLKNEESYVSSDEDTKFYDKTKNNVNEMNNDESNMETLSAVIQEEVCIINTNLKYLKIILCFISARKEY